MTTFARPRAGPGAGTVLLPFFSFMTFLIAVPTGVKFFNWTGTMWRGQVTFEPAMLFAIGFLVSLLLGGLTGVILASPPLDFHVSDSYFMVAHFHYVLFGTVVFTRKYGEKVTVDDPWGYPTSPPAAPVDPSHPRAPHPLRKHRGGDAIEIRLFEVEAIACRASSSQKYGLERPAGQTFLAPGKGARRSERSWQRCSGRGMWIS